MQQDGLAYYVLLAEPERLREIAPIGPAGAALAPLILRESPREVAARQLQQAPVPVRLGVIGRERERAVVACQCVVRPAQIGERVAAIDQGLRMAWPKRQRAVVAGKRLGGAI